jgi:hypothetical protein
MAFISILRPAAPYLLTTPLFVPVAAIRWRATNGLPRDSCTAKIHIIAKVIFKGVLCGILFKWHPNTFSVGFVIGLVFPEQIQNVTDRIYNLHIVQKICLAVMGFWFQLPCAIYSSMFMISAYLGKSCSTILPTPNTENRNRQTTHENGVTPSGIN